MKPQTFLPVPTDEPLDSRHQVAQRVGCHPRTVARAEKRGELTAIKFNARLVRYRRSEVEAWISRAECLH
jgi:excisionase family DNA binding protein